MPRCDAGRRQIIIGEKRADSRHKAPRARNACAALFTRETRYKIGCIRPRDDVVYNPACAARTPCHSWARGAGCKKLGGEERGRGGRRKKDRYDLLSPANSVYPPCTPTALAFIHLFPFHGSPSNPTSLPPLPACPCPSVGSSLPSFALFVPRHLSK